MTNDKKSNTPVWPAREDGTPAYDALAALILNDDELAYDILMLLQRNGIPVKLEKPQVCGGASSLGVNVPADMVNEARAILRESGLGSVVI